MKKTLFLIVMVVISLQLYPQEKKKLQPIEGIQTINLGDEFNKLIKKNENELKVNVLGLILGYGDISYEKIQNKGNGLGISFTYNFTMDIESGYEIALEPFYRLYFEKDKLAAGFFTEMNCAFGKSQYSNDFGLGLGLGVGWKYFIKSTWFAEVSLGMGRNFLQDEKKKKTVFYPRFGISLGKRF